MGVLDIIYHTNGRKDTKKERKNNSKKECNNYKYKYYLNNLVLLEDINILMGSFNI